MTPATELNTRPPLATYEDLSRMVDYAIVSPEASEDSVSQACDRARQQRVGRVTVRPSDLDLVSRWMDASGISVGAVVSYPHGTDTTAVKLYSVRDAIRRGAKVIETVLSPARMISRQFRYLESEFVQMTQECHRAGVELVVDLEMGWLSDDLKVIACKIARRTEVDQVRPFSLYGPAGSSAAQDLALLTAKLGDLVKVAAPWPDSWEAAREAHAAGVSGFQTTDPAPLLAAWSGELKRRAEEAAKAAVPGPAVG